MPGVVGGRGSGVLREFLDRFRRHAAVPADVADEIGGELVAVFSLLDELDREAATRRAAADARSSTERTATAAAVEQVLAAGRRQADGVRAQAVEEARHAAGGTATEIAAQARAQATEIRTSGRARIPVLVDEVVACVLEQER